MLSKAPCLKRTPVTPSESQKQTPTPVMSCDDKSSAKKETSLYIICLGCLKTQCMSILWQLNPIKMIWYCTIFPHHIEYVKGRDQVVVPTANAQYVIWKTDNLVKAFLNP
jgi:hypothetical protein